MFKDLNVSELGGGIEFIDIGASGGFPRSWSSLIPLINYYAFEPNTVECERLVKEPNDFHTSHYFPFAVADHSGEATLYKTKDIYCYSLLEPNKPLLDRFEFGHKFDVEGTEPLETVQLGEIEQLREVDMDIIKVDSQGLDRRILENARHLLDRAFYVEVEPGFNQSYIGEDMYAEIDRFMRDHGFRLFELTPHRIGRNNQFAEQGRVRGEMLWAESVWIKDLVGLDQVGRCPELTRAKALKCLLICAVEERLDFGFELATWFAEKSLITAEELAALEVAETWQIASHEETVGAPESGGVLEPLIRLLPWSLREKIRCAATSSVEQTHLFKRRS